MFIVAVLGDEFLKESLQIAPRGRCRVLHHRQTATGVLNKHCDGAVADLALVDLIVHFVRDFVSAFALSRNNEFIVMHVHI